MTSASSSSKSGHPDLGRSFARARKEVKKLREQVRRTNRAMAQFEDDLEEMGIKLVYTDKENT